MSTTDTKMPAAIAALGLSPGYDSIRKVMHCPECLAEKDDPDDALENNIDLVSHDVRISWDPVIQEDVVRHEDSNACHCESCWGEGIEAIDFVFSNRKAIATIFAEIAGTSRTREKIAIKDEKRDEEEARIALRIPCCPECGSEDIYWEGKGVIDPYTGRMHAQSVTRNLSCTPCGHLFSAAREVDVSAHRLLLIEQERIRISEQAAAACDEILTWLRANCENYGVSQEDIDWLEDTRENLIPNLLKDLSEPQ